MLELFLNVNIVCIKIDSNEFFNINLKKIKQSSAIRQFITIVNYFIYNILLMWAFYIFLIQGITI